MAKGPYMGPFTVHQGSKVQNLLTCGSALARPKKLRRSSWRWSSDYAFVSCSRNRLQYGFS